MHASASAKLLNTATNMAALLIFIAKGHVWWHVAAVMALANVAGSLLGTRLALKHGAGFVRGVFIVVVSALILKTGGLPASRTELARRGYIRAIAGLPRA